MLTVDDDSVILGVQEVYTRPLYGLLPRKNKSGEAVVK